MKDVIKNKVPHDPLTMTLTFLTIKAAQKQEE